MDKLILDNIVFSLQKAGGISVVWQEILKEILCQKDLNFECLEYFGTESNIFRESLSIPEKNIKLLSGPIALKRFISPKVKIDEPTIFHSSYYRTIRDKHVKNVTTVHDFTYELSTRGFKRKLHTWQKYKAIYGSESVVCISKNTVKDLKFYCPGIEEDKIRIIYNGVSEDYHPLSENEHRDLKNSVLFVGMRGGHKNFQLTVEALSDTKYNLIICGSPLSEEEKAFLNNKLGEERYFYEGRVSNEELNILYNSVCCLAYPSSYEGFGIPVLEAQRARCPVIALNASSIPEVMGAKKFLMNSPSTEEFIKCLSTLENKKVREDIIEEGLEFSQKFSWEKMAKEYMDLYQEISQKK